MASTDPPAFFTTIFNSQAYSGQSGFITLDYANKTYLKLVGGSIFGPLSIGGTLNAGGIVSFTNNTNATSKTTGALIINGGVGIGGDLYSSNISSTNLTLNGSLNTSGVVTLTNTSISSSTTTGALIVSGGVGIGGTLYAGGIVSFTNNTNATSKTTGALIINGGVGIGGDLYTSNISATNLTLNGSLNTSGVVTLTNTSISSSTTTGALIVSGGVGIGGDLYTSNISATNLTLNGSISGATTFSSSGIMTLSNSSISSSYTTGALVITGGVGIGGALNVGGTAYIASGTPSTSPTSGTLRVFGGVGITSALNVGGGVGIGGSLNVEGIATIPNTTSSSSTTTGALRVSGGVGIVGALNVGGSLNVGGIATIPNTTSSSSTTTGALRVSGGVGIVGALNVGGNIASAGNIGIGTTNPIQLLHISSSTANNGGIIIAGGGGNNGRIDFSTYNSTFLGTAAGARILSLDNNWSADLVFQNRNTGSDNNVMNSRMIITASGNVGIGTTSPSYLLHVNGDINLSGSLRVSGTAANLASISGVTNGVGSASKALILDGAKNIQGIGLIDSSAHFITYNSALHALSLTSSFTDTTLRMQNTSAGGRDYYFGVSGTGSSLTTGSFYIYDNTASTARLIITSTPRMLYNTTSSFSNARITLNGSVAVAGTSDWLDGTYQITGSFRTSDNTNEIQIQQGPSADAFIGTKTNNSFCFMTNNVRAVSIDTSQRVGIGTTSPSTYLDVASSNSVTTTTSISINTYTYNLSTDVWTNLGGGPVTVTICARFRSNVWIQDKIYATSDRRLKKDIHPLDFSLEHYSKLNPVSYTWKNDDKIQIGLIAQEVKDVCGESINAIENENMKKEMDDDPEGYQMTIDYNCINMMHIVAIKKLIEDNKNLNLRLKALEDKINQTDQIEEPNEIVSCRGKKLKIRK